MKLNIKQNNLCITFLTSLWSGIMMLNSHSPPLSITHSLSLSLSHTHTLSIISWWEILVVSMSGWQMKWLISKN